jgi:hypothetical protein
VSNGFTTGTCPIHGETQFHSDTPEHGGHRNTCRQCKLDRQQENDRLRTDACIRLFGVVDFSPTSSWKTQLTFQQRRMEVERQRLINASEDPAEVAAIISAIPENIVEIENALNEQEAEGEQPDEEEENGEEDEPEDIRGFIYVFRCESAWVGWVVSGKAKRVSKRLGTYQTYTPNRDFVLVASAFVSERHQAEDELQERLEELGNRQNEWFQVTAEQAAEVVASLAEDFSEEE